jgi:hypothetical protein
MHSRVAFCGVAACLALLALAPARAAAPTLTQADVVARFKTATGSRLVVDRRASRPGHYTALELPPSVTNLALYGDFTIWVVGTATLEEDVAQLLADAHTGTVGEPGAAGIHWEKGTALGGTTRWLAKKRYGENLVLWRLGPTPKVDASFKRLHKVLLQKVAR